MIVGYEKWLEGSLEVQEMLVCQALMPQVTQGPKKMYQLPRETASPDLVEPGCSRIFFCQGGPFS